MARENLGPVPVINQETGQNIGTANPRRIVGAHLRGNWEPYLLLKGKKIACSFNRDDPDGLRILVYPSKSIYL